MIAVGALVGVVVVVVVVAIVVGVVVGQFVAVVAIVVVVVVGVHNVAGARSAVEPVVERIAVYLRVDVVVAPGMNVAVAPSVSCNILQNGLRPESDWQQNHFHQWAVLLYILFPVQSKIKCA